MYVSSLRKRKKKSKIKMNAIFFVNHIFLHIFKKERNEGQKNDKYLVVSATSTGKMKKEERKKKKTSS